MVWLGDRLLLVKGNLSRYVFRLLQIKYSDPPRMTRTAFTFVPYLLQVPVGRETLGRIMNVIGEPVDECGPIGEMLCCDRL